MRNTVQLLLLATAPLTATAADAARPRGVGPEFAKYYKDPKLFTCILNPTITLSPSAINDDYCDCPDGSDEPGTAACSHISPHSPSLISNAPFPGANTTAALPGFYCKNKGHVPSYVPFSNVNDGVCDSDACCDGSEEWERVGGVSCPDRCKEIGKEWRKADEARQKSMTAAMKKRAELVVEAGRLRLGVEEKVGVLRKQIEAGEVRVRELEGKLEVAERKAKGKVVKSTGKGGKVGVLVGLARDRVEELRGGLVRVREERDSARERLEEVEAILGTFKEEYNPNFNDEGVKRAVRAWEDYVAKDKPAVGDESGDKDLDEISKQDTDTEGLKWADWQEDSSDTDLLYTFEAYLPPSIRSWADTKLRDLRLFLIENGVIAGTDIHGDAVDPEVSTARDQTNSARTQLSTQQSDLTRETEDLGKDYGADDIFRALKGHCVSRDSGEYTYELCWLDRTKQKSKKGGGETNMGNFRGLETVEVDDALPPDGKGLGAGRRVAMRYDGGQHCWNGPNRETLVVLACAERDEIWKVSEEEKCVYRMEVGTPAVCEGRKEGKGVRDEL